MLSRTAAWVVWGRAVGLCALAEMTAPPLTLPVVLHPRRISLSLAIASEMGWEPKQADDSFFKGQVSCVQCLTHAPHAGEDLASTL
jgi:hypothetical protein